MSELYPPVGGHRSATMGRPAFVTSTIFEILGSEPRTFRQLVADHAAAFAAAS